jgi:hypothetical protein
MISELKFKEAIRRIDAVHNDDPTSELIDGEEVKAELLYSERMVSILDKVAPESSFELKLAARCQHISRWSIPRATFSIDKKGYYQWRAAIMEHQLKVTATVLQQSGIDDESIAIVVDALKNKADKTNVNASIIEDTACLTFIKWYLVSFAGHFDTEKSKGILVKTTNKMSERGLGLIPHIELDSAVLDILKLID